MEEGEMFPPVIYFDSQHTFCFLMKLNEEFDSKML